MVVYIVEKLNMEGRLMKGSEGMVYWCWVVGIGNGLSVYGRLEETCGCLSGGLVVGRDEYFWVREKGSWVGM